MKILTGMPRPGSLGIFSHLSAILSSLLPTNVLLLGKVSESLCFLRCLLFMFLFSSLFFSLFRKSLPAELSAAAQRRTLPFTAMGYGAVTCCAVLCRAVPCCVVLYLLFHSYQVSNEVSYQGYTRYLLVHSTSIYTKNALSAQLNSASSAAQRSAAPCGAVPCPAVWCRALLRRAALCFLSHRQQYQVSCEVPGTKYRYVLVYL